MKTPVLLAMLAGAIAGTASAVFTGALFFTGSGEAVPAAALEDDSAWTLASEVQRLGEDNAELRDKMTELEQRLVMAASNRAPVQAAEVGVSDELAKLQEEYRALVAALSDPEAVLPATLQAGVTQALKDIREQEDRERDERRETAQAERMEDRITDLSTKLGLDAYQTGEMRTILTAESTKRTEMFTKLRESGDWQNGRESMRTLRDETNDALSKVFTPVQMEAYEKEGGSGFGGGFGRDGGGRRGRGD